MGLLSTLGLNPLPSMATVGAPVKRTGEGRTAQGTGGGTGTEISKAPPRPTGTPPTSTQPKVPVQQGGPERQQVAPGHEQVTAYSNEHKAVKALLDGLAKHAQASRIAAELSQITTKLASAGGFAIKADWPKAMADLATARKLCGSARTHADQWLAYRARRAKVAGMGTALQGLDNAIAGQVATAVSDADNLMAATPPAFNAAMQKLGGIDATVRPTIRDAYMGGIVGALQGCKAMSAELKAFFAADIANGEGIVKSMQASFNANEWGQVLMIWRQGWDVLGSITRHGERRALYATQRAKTVLDIAAVKALPSVAHHGLALDATLNQADALANRATMKMEAGTQLLEGASRLCASLKEIAPLVATYLTEKKLADTDIDGLIQGKATEQLTQPIQAITAQLAAAAQLASQARIAKTDPGALWRKALTTLQQARTDIVVAKGMAAQMGPALAAEAAAKGGNTDSMKKALATLKNDLAAARKLPGADAAKATLDQCQTQIEITEQALGKKDAATAGVSLQMAGQALAQARIVQMLHSQFVPMAQTLDINVQQLKALKTAASLGPKIAEVEKALAEAKKLDAGHHGEDAMAALRRASTAVTAARDAHFQRTEYEALRLKVMQRQAELKDPSGKKAMTEGLVAANALADQFKFAEGQAALKKLLVKLDDAKLQAGMKTTPPDPKLRDLVKQMVANGGASSVDAAIQKAPNGNPKVITELASARYGKEFKFEGTNPGAHEVTSMKRCCEVWATIPGDIVNNPSIKDVSHVDAQGAGGAYTGSTGHIGMEGRVGYQQKFGKDEVNHDPKTGKPVKALPDKIDKDCLPAKGDIEYMGFAAAHEVGHGVDDLRSFMAKNGSQEKYGGWIEYGGNVKPIADLIGAKVGGAHKGSKFYADAESKKYVLDKLQSGPAERPSRAILGSVDCDKAESDAYDAFDTWHAMATADNVYRRQGDCDAIQLGNRIYHEAYPRAWVSYLASARLKGLTGYQFRAPAEWFAELYAGYKSGRLGKKHPALEWLKKL